MTAAGQSDRYNVALLSKDQIKELFDDLLQAAGLAVKRAGRYLPMDFPVYVEDPYLRGLSPGDESKRSSKLLEFSNLSTQQAFEVIGR